MHLGLPKEGKTGGAPCGDALFSKTAGWRPMKTRWIPGQSEQRPAAQVIGIWVGLGN